MSKPSMFTNDMVNFIKEIVKGKSTIELADLVNKKFGTNFSPKQIYRLKKRFKLKSGPLQIHKKPLFSESFFAGNVYIKIAQPDVWVKKYKYIWEQANGKIPENHYLIFLNNDRKDVRLENLALVSPAENLILHTKKRVFNDPNMTKSGILLSKLDLILADKNNNRRIPINKIKNVKNLLNKGFSHEEIAKTLNVQVKTVKTYIGHIKRIGKKELNL